MSDFPSPIAHINSLSDDASSAPTSSVTYWSRKRTKARISLHYFCLYAQAKRKRATIYARCIALSAQPTCESKAPIV